MMDLEIHLPRVLLDLYVYNYNTVKPNEPDARPRPITVLSPNYTVPSMSSYPILRTHQSPHIPNQHPLVPPATRAPALRPKHAPIHPDDELRVPPHPAQLLASSQRHGVRHAFVPHPQGAAVRPHPARHVVTRAQQDVREVRAPGHLPHRVIVTRQHRQRTLVRCSDIEGPDDPVDARGGDDGVAVFVPVVRQGFRRRNAGGGGQTGPGARRGM